MGWLDIATWALVLGSLALAVTTHLQVRQQERDLQRRVDEMRRSEATPTHEATNG